MPPAASAASGAVMGGALKGAKGMSGNPLAPVAPVNSAGAAAVATGAPSQPPATRKKHSGLIGGLGQLVSATKRAGAESSGSAMATAEPPAKRSK